MEVTLESISDLERKMCIVVPSAEVDSKVDDKLKQTAGQVRIKGFRPGKVPLREVKRRFGVGILQEVSSEMMQQSFAEAIQQETVNPAGTPTIEDVVIEAGKDLTFTALFEVFPDIEPGDFSTIQVVRPVADISESDLDSMVERLREQRKEFVTVDRAAAVEDQVNIDYSGSVDGEDFEGGQADGSDIVIGSGSMIPGFEEGLTGLSAGDETALDVTFPEDYQKEELAGKQAVFKIKVNKVEESQLPEVDQSFFKEFGVEEGDLEAFRVEVRANMEKELKAAVDNKVKSQIMDGLVDSTEISVPKALVNDEIDRMRQDMVRQFGGGQQFDASMLPAELFEDQSIRRVQLGLIVNAIVEKNNMVVDADRVREKIEEIASSYEQPEQLVNYYYSNEEQLKQVQSLVMEEQVVESILSEAEVTDQEMPYEEAIKPPEQAEQAEDEAAQAGEADATTEDDIEDAVIVDETADDDSPAPEADEDDSDIAQSKE
ncbi:MAG: trigger factor [Gammaproteobacteria bacterium]|jgi:trigger factor|nr:trigger factor [Gammaproteobacteria bacterium]MBT5602442.1 trigger factor [Gammaproteobacteria bacterium]MBT6245230.1 trigger factor [Gammaproteobacteria bacterium]